MNAEMISVIVPVYNVKPWIGRCLDSIMAQTYPCLEIIVVDDGSTDGSGRICEEYAARDKRIQVLHLPENRGPSAARNQGIVKAKGAYLSFIDSDDCAKPDLLEKLYRNLVEHRADISACAAYGIDIKTGPACTYSGREAIDCLALGMPFNHVPWGKLYPAQLVKRYPFDEAVFYSEDLLFLYQIMKHVKRVCYFPEKLYHYTAREGSQVQSGVDERKMTALPVQKSVCQDAATYVPEALPGFRKLALDTDRCLAVLAVKNGTKGDCSQYLKRLQKDIRSHFDWKALALFSRRKDRAAVLMLYVSTTLFKGITKGWWKWIR